MTSRIRFGIVGTGGIANTHAAALAALAEAIIQGVDESGRGGRPVKLGG